MDNIATFENPIVDDTADIVDADDVEANLRTTGEKSTAVSSGRNAGGKKQPGASARSRQDSFMASNVAQIDSCLGRIIDILIL